MPQIDQIDTFASQIFWLFVCFGVIYFFMARMVTPKLGGVIETRNNTIATNISDAERMKDDAVKAAAQHSSSANDTKGQAFAITQQANKEANAIYDKGLAETDNELKKHIEASEKEINMAKDKAMNELSSNVSAYVEEIVTKVAGMKADKASVDKIVKKKVA